MFNYYDLFQSDSVNGSLPKFLYCSMQRTGDTDIILDILERARSEKPESAFIKSLHQQYCERGSLSRKQLEGLHSKASKIPSIPNGRLATLQAIILKKPVKYRSDKIKTIVPETKEDNSLNMVDGILVKYPEHKRAIFLKALLIKNMILTNDERSDLERIYKIIMNSKR